METQLDKILDDEAKVKSKHEKIFKVINASLFILGCISNILLYLVYSIHASGALITMRPLPNPIPETHLMKNIVLYFTVLNTFLLISWILIQNLKKQKS